MMASNRFVILEHRHPGAGRADHWDLMMECPTRQALITFEIPRHAMAVTAGQDGGDENPGCFTGHRLPDHRMAYLTYEGPVSNQRGHVTRVISGHFRLVRAVPANGSLSTTARSFPWKLELRTAEFAVELTFFRKNSVDYHIQYQRS